MNEPILKFGYPTTLISDYSSWLVLLRPEQITLGSLVLACKEPVHSFGDVSSDGYTELACVTKDIENALKHAFDYGKINYLMLMMVDPDVHFHVVPRYSENRSFNQITCQDSGWPGPPNLGQPAEIDETTKSRLIEQLIETWNSTR